MKLTRGNRRIQTTRQNRLAVNPFQPFLHFSSKPASTVAPIFRRQPYGTPDRVPRAFCLSTGETPGDGILHAATGGLMTCPGRLYAMKKRAYPNPSGVSHA